MTLSAHTSQGVRVYAPQITGREPFFCCHCKKEMSWVDASLKIKHFRHKVKADCDKERETAEHDQHVWMVYQEIISLGLAQAHLEYIMGDVRADVFWDRSPNMGIAFEVQATNYSIKEYDKKIRFYAQNRFLVVYIFIGNKFMTAKDDNPNIFSLKEIERRIFDTKNYKDTVMGCYYSGGYISIPSYTRKYAKGGGLCTHRYIQERGKTEKCCLRDYLKKLYSEYPKDSYDPVCFHENSHYVTVEGNYPRVYEICEDCGITVRNVRYREAQMLGLL